MGRSPGPNPMPFNAIRPAWRLPIRVKQEKMKRLYAKLTGETLTESESGPTLTGLLAAFLSGVLCCMLLHWLLF